MVEKQYSTSSECVSVVLVIQRAMYMRRIILSSVARPALQYFSTLYHKRHDFGGINLLNMKLCCFSLQLLFETFLILERTERDVIKNVYWSSYKCLYSCHIFMELEFSRRFFEKYSDVKFRENPSNGSPNCSLRTDMTKLIVAFRSFTIEPNKRVVNTERIDYYNGSKRSSMLEL